MSEPPTLQAVLADPQLVLLFREHLKDSYSSENLTFIIEIENFKELWSQGAEDEYIKKRAHEIYQKYFSDTSKYELNVPGPLLEDLKERMKNPNTSTFNRVQQSIFKLIESDSYPRFIKSELFQKHWAELQKNKKKNKKEKKFDELFAKEKKKNPLYSKLYSEISNSRNDRSSTVALLEEFFVSRPSREQIVKNYEQLSNSKPPT